MNPETLEEFFYISDRKVDSYAAQLPKGLSGVSAELSAHLGVISAKLATKEYAQNRVSRMLLVRKFIEEHYQLGSTELSGDVGTWVRDELVVQQIYLKDVPELFLLLGLNDEKEICALIGAAQHIVGNSKGEQLGCSLSFYHAFASAISDQVAHFEARDVELDGQMQIALGLNVLETGNEPDEICRILSALLHDATGPKFHVSFLARSIFSDISNWGMGATRAYKVFSPLYVSP